MKETFKLFYYREKERHHKKYMQGEGIDIGSGNDLLYSPYAKTIPFDYEDGDANYMEKYNDNTFDFVYSSHCLEHMINVETALHNWCRIIKPNGYLYMIVPDWTHYEKELWPSRFNPDHKHTFSTTVTKQELNRNNHFHSKLDLEPILEKNNMITELNFLQLYDYDHNLPKHIDQTLGKAVCQILIVAKKQ